MLILLSMAVALAAFFAVMLWLDPQRKRAVVAAVVVVGTAGAANSLPTVGGSAYADDEDIVPGCNIYADAPWVSPDGGAGESCFEDDGPPDLISVGPQEPTGNPFWNTRWDPNDDTCNFAATFYAASFSYGIFGLAAPEPIISKVFGGVSLGLGALGTLMWSARGCGDEPPPPSP